MLGNFYKKKFFWIIFLFIVAIIVLRLCGFAHYFSLENIKQKKDALAQFIQAHYALSMFLYWLLYVFENVFALPIAAGLTVGAGYFYGVVPGTLLTVISATSGALISFFLARYLFGDFFQKGHAHPSERFNEVVKSHGVYYLLFVRIIPVFPFVWINLICGLTALSWWTFMWTTVLGMIPSTVIYTLAGRQLHSIGSVRDILSWPMLLLLFLIALVALSPVLVAFFLEKKERVVE